LLLLDSDWEKTVLIRQTQGVLEMGRSESAEVGDGFA